MTGRVIVIACASEGIGAQLAYDLAARGDHLVLAARDIDRLRQVAGECGNGALPVVTDVTRRADVERLRDDALNAFEHVDVWVNNAGFPGIHIYLVMPGGVTTDFSRNALHGKVHPTGFRPIANAQTQQEVSRVIVDLIDHPQAEVYTNPAVQLDLVKRYYARVADFEESMR